MPRGGRIIPTVRVVHVCPPILVQTDLSNFQAVVQKLTGKRKILDTQNERTDCHVCDGHSCNLNPNCAQTTIDELDCLTLIIDGCLKDASCRNNQCSHECVSDDTADIGVESLPLPQLQDAGCLSPNLSTNSSSSNNRFTYNEVTSCTIGVAPAGDRSADGDTTIDKQNLVMTSYEGTPRFACSNGSSRPAKRIKATNCLSQESHFDYGCNISMDQHMHAEENSLISGFITPPLFSLDEQLVAEYGDHDLLQELYDMEIFPLTSTCN